MLVRLEAFTGVLASGPTAAGLAMKHPFRGAQPRSPARAVHERVLLFGRPPRRLASNRGRSGKRCVSALDLPSPCVGAVSVERPRRVPRPRATSRRP
eukprot:7135763-Prymnesium_polylepis.1